MKWKLAVSANCRRDRNSGLMAVVGPLHPVTAVGTSSGWDESGGRPFHPFRRMRGRHAVASVGPMQLKQERPATAGGSTAGDGPGRGDVLVAFGITGALARQMTLPS